MTDYSKHYYCVGCHKAVQKDEAIGVRPKCPRCGRLVRMKPRGKRRQSQPKYNDRV